MNTQNDPAFPVAGFMYDGVLRGQLFHGLTKRELFAAMAMQGYLSDTNNNGRFEDIANDAVKQADALIAALNAADGEK